MLAMFRSWRISFLWYCAAGVIAFALLQPAFASSPGGCCNGNCPAGASCVQPCYETDPPLCFCTCYPTDQPTDCSGGPVE